MEIKSVNISRSYGRKIKYGSQYEMVDIFSSYTAICEEGLTEAQIKKVSEKIYQKAKEEVDLQVDILQNPGKVVRGYNSITDLQNRVRVLEKENEKLKKEQDKPPFVS